MMLEFICYFMPAFISLSIFRGLGKKDYTTKDYIIYYGIFVVTNNLFTLTMICLRNFNEILYFDRVGITYLFKYLIMSVVFSIITPFIVPILSTNVKLRVEVLKSEKSSKEDKKRKKNNI